MLYSRVLDYIYVCVFSSGVARSTGMPPRAVEVNTPEQKTVQEERLNFSLNAGLRSAGVQKNTQTYYTVSYI